MMLTFNLLPQFLRENGLDALLNFAANDRYSQKVRIFGTTFPVDLPHALQKDIGDDLQIRRNKEELYS